MDLNCQDERTRLFVNSMRSCNAWDASGKISTMTMNPCCISGNTRFLTWTPSFSSRSAYSDPCSQMYKVCFYAHIFPRASIKPIKTQHKMKKVTKNSNTQTKPLGTKHRVPPNERELEAGFCIHLPIYGENTKFDCVMDN